MPYFESRRILISSHKLYRKEHERLGLLLWIFYDDRVDISTNFMLIKLFIFVITWWKLNCPIHLSWIVLFSWSELSYSAELNYLIQLSWIVLSILAELSYSAELNSLIQLNWIVLFSWAELSYSVELNYLILLKLIVLFCWAELSYSAKLNCFIQMSWIVLFSWAELLYSADLISLIQLYWTRAEITHYSSIYIILVRSYLIRSPNAPLIQQIQTKSHLNLQN